MPTLEWLKKEFHYGYDSGSIMSWLPSRRRRNEEKRIGGSYKDVCLKALFSYLKDGHKVLEIGPGKGSWSREILKRIPNGELHTVDYLDVAEWLKPERYNGRLKCFKVSDNNYEALPENYYDFVWSFGVLCHNNISKILEVLKNSYSKIKKGGIAVHEYGDWDKLEKFGWEKAGIPRSFREIPDDSIWWPRNNQQKMCETAIAAGWKVLVPDLDLVKRDSIIVLKKE